MYAARDKTWKHTTVRLSWTWYFTPPIPTQYKIICTVIKYRVPWPHSQYYSASHQRTISHPHTVSNMTRSTYAALIQVSDVICDLLHTYHRYHIVVPIPSRILIFKPIHIHNSKLDRFRLNREWLQTWYSQPLIPIGHVIKVQLQPNFLIMILFI